MHIEILKKGVLHAAPGIFAQLVWTDGKCITYVHGMKKDSYIVHGSSGFWEIPKRFVHKEIDKPLTSR